MRLIDVDDIPKSAYRGDVYDLMDALLSAPTINAVPVVRCRECRYNGQPTEKGFAQCELDALIREPEFWCRAGQRREDGDGEDA